MFTSAALAGVYQRIGGIIVKRIKSIVLLSLAALLCFAAMAMATPKSLVITDEQSGSSSKMGYYLLTVYQYDKDFKRTTKYWGSVGGATGLSYATSTLESAKDLVKAALPAQYIGDVSIDVLTSTRLSNTTNNTFLSDYWYTLYQDPGFFDKITPPKPGLLTSCDYAVISDNTGKVIFAPFKQNIDDKSGEGSFTAGMGFFLSEDVTPPVNIYFIKLDHTKHTVTATAGTGGTITPASADVEEGASCEFVITADKGYVIDALTVDNSAVAAAAGNASYTYTLENVTKAAKISVTFKKSIEPGKENVSEIGASGEGVTAAEPVFVEASDKIVASFDAQADNSKELPLVKADGTSDQNVTFKKEAFVCAVKLDVTHTDAAAAMTLAFSPVKDKTFDAAKKYYAMILNKKTGAYAIFECAQANGKLNMTVRPVGDYFSENTVVVYTGTATNAGGDTPSTGGGSGGGCNAGMAALALLALVPLALRRKK